MSHHTALLEHRCLYAYGSYICHSILHNPCLFLICYLMDPHLFVVCDRNYLSLICYLMDPHLYLLFATIMIPIFYFSFATIATRRTPLRVPVLQARSSSTTGSTTGTTPSPPLATDHIVALLHCCQRHGCPPSAFRLASRALPAGCLACRHRGWWQWNGRDDRQRLPPPSARPPPLALGCSCP
jgi:hypothetical protein